MAEKRRNRDIQNILTVLGSAVICAGLLALVFLYYYGPSGHYLAGNTLLDPTIIGQIHYQDEHSRTGKKVRFVFDHIEFSYFDSQKGQLHVSPIPLEAYQKFYKMVAFVKSLEEIKDVEKLFLQSHPTLLTIRMRTKEGFEGMATRVFQVVQFAAEDYFRVQLHGKNEGEWAYFYWPDIYQEIIHLFTQV
jgi:hypothetical protein